MNKFPAWLNALVLVVLLAGILFALPNLYGSLAAIQVAAGVYQWTPLKDACLAHCRAPLEFVARHWRDGSAGAVRMGIEHGAFCLGCCWILMGLLFFGGVMNLLWVAAIAIFVLVEKVAPWGAVAGRAGGALLVLTGLYIAGSGA